VGRETGIRLEQLEAVGSYASSAAFTDREKAVLRLADAMTDVPADVSDELFEQLHNHFSERELTELASALAWENYRARFNRAFLVESEDLSEGAFCPVPLR
jgi:alkylhydroperoxidase family enzyme